MIYISVNWHNYWKGYGKGYGIGKTVWS